MSAPKKTAAADPGTPPDAGSRGATDPSDAGNSGAGSFGADRRAAEPAPGDFAKVDTGGGDAGRKLEILQARLAAAEQRFYNLSRLTSAWLWETGPEFTLTYVSYRVFEMLGYHPQEMIGRSLRDFGSFVTLQDFASGGTRHSTFQDVFFETRDRRGQRKLFLTSGLPVYDQRTGGFLGMQGTAEDVTRHPRADAQFEALFEDLDQSLVLVMIAGPEGEIEYANAKFREATGYSSEELRRVTPKDLLAQRSSGEAFDEKWQVLRDGAEWRGETHYRRKAGESFWTLERICPVPSDGGVMRYAYIVEDETAHRVYRRQSTTEGDAELFLDMSTRIRNAIQLVMSSENCLLTKLQMDNEAIYEALDRLPLGTIVVDAFSRPLRTNEAADEILKQEDGIKLGRDGLIANVDGGTVKLKDVIWRAGRRSAAKRADRVAAFALERPSGARSLSLVVAPLPSESHYFDKDRPAALVFISDPEIQPIMDEDCLIKLYGLTRAEARLASLLVQDMSLAEAAEILDVSQHTVRTHVKRIFSKTLTERQAELVRMLVSGPAQVRLD